MEKVKRDKLDLLYDKYIKDIKATNQDQEYDLQFVLSDGDMKKGVMLIGEAPGKDEVEQNKPFVGMAGGKLKEFMDFLELERSDIFVTNIIKYRLYSVNPTTKRMRNRPAKKQEILQSRQCLIDEIDIIQPSMILTLGNVPLHALIDDFSLNVGMCHGKKMQYKDMTHIPLYHPASLIYNRNLESLYMKDLEYIKTLINQ